MFSNARKLEGKRLKHLRIGIGMDLSSAPPTADDALACAFEHLRPHTLHHTIHTTNTVQ